jgi:hypothetical protein
MAVNQTIHRLLWFVTLWAGGVITVGILAYGIRLMIK